MAVEDRDLREARQVVKQPEDDGAEFGDPEHGVALERAVADAKPEDGFGGVEQRWWQGEVERDWELAEGELQAYAFEEKGGAVEGNVCGYGFEDW